MEGVLKVVVISILALASFGYILQQSLESNGHGEDLQEVVYRGAVLEMVPFVDPNLTPLDNMLANIRIMASFAQKAKEQDADIIVFPEYVLATDPPFDRPSFKAYTQYVTDLSMKESPCDWKTPYNHDEIVRNASCVAKQLEIYVVLNMPERVDCNRHNDPNCPEDDQYFYNLNVVFDRRGVVVSKWRKLHLFREPFMNEGRDADETAIFTTDFGVTFTQQICFDAIFARPAINNIRNYGIRDVVMSTSWVDYMPFSTAPQAQYAFSRGSNVNLLVAGRHLPEYGAIGSGIYTGAVDIKDSANIYDDTQGTHLLVKDVRTYANPNHISRRKVKPSHPKKHKLDPKLEQSFNKVTPSKHLFIKEDLDEFYSQYIFRSSGGTSSGSYSPSGAEPGESIDFTFDWKLDGEADYFLVMKSGIVGFGQYLVYRQIVGVVYCPSVIYTCGGFPSKKPAKGTFEHFNLTIQFNTRQLFPAIVDQDLALIGEDKWEYSTWKVGDRYSASIVNKEPLEHMYSAAVFGRWYSRDPFCKDNPC